MQLLSLKKKNGRDILGFIKKNAEEVPKKNLNKFQEGECSELKKRPSLAPAFKLGLSSEVMFH